MRTVLSLGGCLLAAVMAGLVCSDAAGSAEAAASGQVASIDALIVGTWRLESIYEEDSGGEDVARFGRAPKGFFMADGAGNFSFQIMNGDERRYAAGGGLPAVKPPALIYSGTYALDRRNNKLTLHLSNCVFRSCDNADRTADLRIRGDTMELISAAERSPTGASYSRIVWKRE